MTSSPTEGPVPRFEDVHRDFRPRIQRYLARLAGPGEAEDLTQEVFVRVAQALGGFRGDSSLATWIYRIATNAAIDRLREPARRRAAAEPLGVATADPAPGVEEQAIRQEMSGCIRDFVDRLPPRYRAVVVLSDLEGLGDGEIAEVLGITVGAAKIRLHRGRARLRAALEAGCDLSRDGADELACEPKPSPLLRIVSRPAAVDMVRTGRMPAPERSGDSTGGGRP